MHGELTCHSRYSNDPHSPHKCRHTLARSLFRMACLFFVVAGHRVYAEEAGAGEAVAGWLASLAAILEVHTIPALFAVIGLGMVFGRISFFGVKLGNSGVIFAAIAFGALGYRTPSSIGNLGLVLFVYCIGITAGPGFFRSFARQGSNLAQLGLLLTGLGALTAVLLAWLFGIPAGLAVGIFAGAMTSTPALAAALEALGDTPEVSVGYVIAYPFGAVGVVMFVQVLPRLLRLDLNREALRHGHDTSGEGAIERAVIKVTNPALFGKSIREQAVAASLHCQISRVSRGDALVPVAADSIFEEGGYVLAVGKRNKLALLTDYLGEKSDRAFAIDVERERLRVVATAKAVTGKTLRELNLRHRFGVTITRLERNAVTLAPHSETVIQYADRLTAVGEPDNLGEFAKFAGHRAKALDETDMLSVAAGIVLGLALGQVPLLLPGGVTVRLGMAGGPLFLGLLLGHFGRIGPLSGYIPRPARMFMLEIGLVLFLAAAGSQAGEQFLATLREYGLQLPLMAVLVAALPMGAGYLFASRCLKLNLLQILGGICGGMTSTPGLGAVTGKTDSDLPVVSYAAVYPLALILVTLAAQLLARVISVFQ